MGISMAPKAAQAATAEPTRAAKIRQAKMVT